MVFSQVVEAVPLGRINGLAALAGSGVIASPVDIDAKTPRFFIIGSTFPDHRDVARPLADGRVACPPVMIGKLMDEIHTRLKLGDSFLGGRLPPEDRRIRIGIVGRRCFGCHDEQGIVINAPVIGPDFTQAVQIIASDTDDEKGYRTVSSPKGVINSIILPYYRPGLVEGTMSCISILI